jgi:hypothetical protein
MAIEKRQRLRAVLRESLRTIRKADWGPQTAHLPDYKC